MVKTLLATLMLLAASCAPAAAETWIVKYFPMGSSFVFPTQDTYYLILDQLNSTALGRLYFQYVPCAPPSKPCGWQFVGYYPAALADLPANFPNVPLALGDDIFIYQPPDSVVGVPLGDSVNLQIQPTTSTCVVRGGDLQRKTTLKPADCAELTDLLSDGLARVPAGK